ncbi:MAG: hypothetical protein AAB425_01720, partial [Bdellovibrionota bacterium]
LRFLIATESDRAGLNALFPQAIVHHTGEPRWDRVIERMQRSSVVGRIAFDQKQSPCGVIGSAWEDDIQTVLPGWLRAGSGSLYVFPHQCDRVHAERLKGVLKNVIVRSGYDHRVDLRTWETNQHPPRLANDRRQIVFVPQKGFLTEFYGHADWVFVGGGFGAGIHSTIEPALSGKPIAAGPVGADKFSEVLVLMHSGQLTFCNDSGDFERWLGKLEFADASPVPSPWKSAVDAQLGAAQKILLELNSVVDFKR